MPTSDTFETAYTRLNAAQKRAVDTIEGPVMVVAGPGTGKTQILALRIANILLKTDAAPDSILAIAFTESAVKAMRKRLLSIIGTRAYQVSIHTFHGFANDRIGEFPDAFPDIIGGRPARDIERIRIVESVLEKGNWEELRPSGDPSYYVKPIIGTIASLKREGYTPEKFEVYVEGQQREYDAADDKVHLKGAHKGKIKAEYVEKLRKIAKNKELAKVYAAYENALHEARLYDFEDMIIEMAAALKEDTDMLRTLQERFQYILVDEHQDTNSAQNAIIELLAGFHENPNLFVVGDEKQAIYRFQGASLENFLYFKKRFAGAELIRLEENYRSTQSILDASHSLILKNAYTDTALIAPLRSQAKEKKPVTVLECAGPDEEAIFMARDIKKHLSETEKACNIAVIYRDNADVWPIADALSKEGIRHAIRSDHNIFEDDDIARFIDLLRLVLTPASEDLLGKVIFHSVSGLKFLDASKLVVRSHRERLPLIDLLRTVSEGAAFVERLGLMSEAAYNKPLRDALEEIVEKFGVAARLIAHERRDEKFDALRALLDEAEKLLEEKRTATLKDFVEHLDSMAAYNISIKRAQPHDDDTCVELMTAHRSKGLEFDFVYVCGVYDGHWGNRRSREVFSLPGIGTAEAGLDDERRLFYVALTRARKHVTVTYPRLRRDGRELLPSPFIEEIDSALIDRKTDDTVRPLPGSAKDNVSSMPLFETADFKNFVRGLFLEQGLSVTALNAYIQCPWQYFFNNLIRVPRLKTTHELYGTAIHAALQKLFMKLKKEEQTTKEELIASAVQTLEHMPLGAADLKALRKRAEESLGAYYDAYHKTWHANSMIEYVIATHVPVIDPAEGTLVEVPIRGNIDKIELHEGGTAIVVDYKTGAPKSRNDIMGKTKSSDGNYFRQLTFYRMLFEASDLAKQHSFGEGVIDFIQPDQKGNMHREQFTITPEDVDTVRASIQKTAEEILSLSFVHHECDVSCEDEAISSLLKALRR